jgi:hypothetical protein
MGILRPNLVIQRRHTLRIVFVCLMFSVYAITASWSQTDTLAYSNAKQQLRSGRVLYQYGNFKPRNMHEAFIVFLTGDSSTLRKFQLMPVEEAVSFALLPESGLFRFDWGGDAFFHFSRFCIEEFGLYAPELQHYFAIHLFHGWMNGIGYNANNLAKSVARQNRKVNRYWKKKFRYYTKTLSKSYDRIWKTDEKERKAERKRPHRHLR